MPDNAGSDEVWMIRVLVLGERIEMTVQGTGEEQTSK